MNWLDEVTADVSMVRYNTWRVGGKAQWLFAPKDVAHLCRFLRSFPDNVAIHWLGLGSNLLIRDGGLPGLVIQTQVGLNLVESYQDGMKIQAGVTCGKAARLIAQQGHTGGEFFVGIPGTIGGAIVMNAGAFGGETWRYLEGVDVINRQGEVNYRPKHAFGVGYRHVDGLQDEEWILNGYFAFPRGDAAEATNAMKRLLKERGEKQPIGQPSCGSVFRNPPNDFAARLIESCGLKGYAIGGAFVSEKHANFIINGGSASACDIETLMEHVRSSVFQSFGVMLEDEVHIKGLP